jgi:hypothetical protein
MDAINALRIARLALAMNYRIAYSEHEQKYINVGMTRQDQEAADAYNKLADIQAKWSAAEAQQHADQGA